MKAFLAGLVLIVVIAAGAMYALDSLHWTAAESTTSDRGSVRLGDAQ